MSWLFCIANIFHQNNCFLRYEHIKNILLNALTTFTAQKMEFSIKDFFIKCDQFRWKLQIRSHLLKKSLMENFIFCALFN